MDPGKFLTELEEKAVIEAIQEAERNTSGEIRVHFERGSELGPIERAQEVFYSLGMDKTKNKNGVLFYVAVDDHQFAILGDEGIDHKVPDDFWESIRDEVIREFKKSDFSEGLRLGILHAGEKLKEFFPYEDSDENELSDEISRQV